VNKDRKIKIWAQANAVLIIKVNKICIQKKIVKVMEDVSENTGH
jgi:hypothetical protein